MEQQNYVMLAAILAGVVVLALIVVAMTRGRRHRELKDRFGPEYDRAVADVGKRSKAEKELEERAKRVEKLPLHPLAPAEKARFEDLWRTAQAHFVDSPLTAVTEADELVSHVMRARGYPMADFDQRAADLSVDHPSVVDNYRRAHDLTLRAQAGSGSTDDLRQAFVYYRALFAELLESTAVAERAPEPVTH
jgi:hypothetical protein